jgi:hypothetical protein
MEPERLLDELLQLWRKHRAPELVPLVEQASRAAAARRPPVSPQKTMQLGWLSRSAARDPADLPHLLHVLTDARSAEALARLDALAAWADDPRLVTHLLDYVQ